MLRARGVVVSYTLPSDVNGDGIVNIQDLVSVTQHFGVIGDLTADVNKDGIVNITDLTQVAGDLGDTTVNAETTDAVDIADTAPGEKPRRDDAFIFREFLEHLLSDLKAVYLDFDFETIFQTPGKGFIDPTRACSVRGHSWRVLGIYIPDAITGASVQQINRFSSEYKLTREEFITLGRNIRHAKICVDDPELHVVTMPDENLRKAVVARINELGISLGPINTPKKTTDPIYAGEMRKITHLSDLGIVYPDGPVGGIESLIGLEYATNLTTLDVGNVYPRDWDIIFFKVEVGGKIDHRYRVPKPPNPNRISDLTPLENLTNLTHLILNCNAVSDLTPLRNLRKLKLLDLTENEITDISPLADLTNLEQLYLRNHYYSPLWAGNNKIRDLAPLRNLKKLEWLEVGHNPIGGRIGVVRNFPKLRGLLIGCCGVSNLRPLVESPGLQGVGSHVYLAHSPINQDDFPDIAALEARGVEVIDGTGYDPVYGGDSKLIGKVFKNYVERCSVSYRESFRAAPALQPLLRTEPDVLSSFWHDLSQVPEETALMPNYPNPFNPETWIPYQLATSGEVTMAIHAADGRLVRTLALGNQAAGVYKSKGRAAYWDGKNEVGEPVASGVYFYTLTAGDFTATRKMLIRK